MWSGTSVISQRILNSAHSTIPHLLEIQAEQRPDATAVIGLKGPPLSFCGLFRQAEETVRSLNALGIGRNDRVALVLPNGPEMAAAFLSVACCATAAPLNPTYRANEFDFYLSDLNAKALIVQERIGSPAVVAAQRHSIPVIELSAAAQDSAGVFSLRGQEKPCESNYGFAEPEDIALVLHTSGTTAKPKRVPLTHANLLASAANIGATLELTDKDRCLNVMPLFHIHGLVGALLASMITGSSVVCASGFDPERFFKWLEEFAPTWYTAVPTMHQAVLTNSETGHGMVVPSSLRLIRSSSAPLPPKVMAGLEELFQVPVIQAYGMTEASNQITSNPLPPRERKAGSVGVAIGTQVAIMDEAGGFLPSGARGEVVIRGSNVMAGYDGEPAANQSAFTASWLRTGDQGYLDKDGYLFISGRLKEIINRGGEKVSPYEVEAVLREHPAIAEAAVFPLAHPTLGEDVCAAVVAQPNVSITEHEILQFAARKLAEFKVPRQVVIVDEIPKGPTGKVQRNRLAGRFGLSTAGKTSDRKTELAAPRTSFEIKLSEIWRQVLRAGPMGVRDNFFELGGDSILATQVANRVRQILEIDLSVADTFQAATISDQAVLVEKRLLNHSEPASKGDPIPCVSTEGGTFPLSASQRRLWLFQQLNPASPVAHRPLALLLTGSLDQKSLQQSLNEIVRRHEIFRTVYRQGDGEPKQIVLPATPLNLEINDLRNLPEADREAAARRIAAAESKRLFDLAEGPLIRGMVLRLGELKHVLLVLMHHILFDGWSAAIMVKELQTIYETVTQGRPASLPALSIQYADFAVWQQKRHSEAVLEKSLTYWKEQLSGIGLASSLPTDYSRSGIPVTGSARRSFVLPSSLADRLELLASGEQATLFMTLLAGFQILLGRYSRQEDVAVGTLIAGRTRVEIEALIGCFINTLVLRTDLSGNPTFRGLLGRVRKTTREAYAHQELPFERLLEALPGVRRPNQVRLFQVLFQLRNMPRATASKAGKIRIESFPFDAGIGGQELSLEIVRAADGLHCTYDYAPELFRAQTIDRIAQHYQTLLEAVVEDPDRLIDDLPLVNQQERDRLLQSWKAPVTDQPQLTCIHELFEKQAQATPDATAVVSGGEQLTYAELNCRANQWAHHLQKLGVGPEVLVGVCMERSVEMVIAILGVLKAGGAYVPLSPSYPRERLDFMIADAHVRLVLMQRPLQDRISTDGLRVLCVESNDPIVGEEPGENPAETALPHNLAYVIFTSGSTGRPKAVLVQHQGIGNMIEAQIRAFNIHSQSRVCQFAALSFDASVSEIFTALLAGATLVIPIEDRLLSGSALTDFLQEQAISVVTLPPSVISSLPQVDLPQLQTIVAAGEACTPDLASRWGKGRRFVNAYGPSEATVCATMAEADGGNWQPVIGRPLTHTHVYLIDADGRPVPAGVPGEVYIGGVALARGYLNRPEMTAERFIPNPFTSKRGERLYKTGDLARLLSNGNIEFLGRVDGQVKIRGFRIELEEIEAVLRQHPQVQHAVVAGDAEAPDKNRLIAYVVPAQGTDPNVSELRSFLQQTLPDFMMPAAFVTLDALPLSPNGKVDRRSLPVPNAKRPYLEQPYLPPRTAVEEKLAVIWRELLGVQEIGVLDNFFELGGHSLLLTQFASRIMEVFQIRVPLRVLFDRPTIDQMSVSILEMQLKNVGREKTDQLLGEIAQLSPAEVLDLLRAP
jgi:amino acid adenylation domain-containing protein